MSSSPRRLASVLAAVVVLVIAFVALRPKDDDDTTPSTPTTAAAEQATSPTTSTAAAEPSTPAPTTAVAPAPKPKPKPKPPLLTAEKSKRLTFKKGDTIKFRARSAGDDEIHVHGYDISKDAPAGKTVSMSFKATIDGIFEVEFENAGTEIASLRVNP